MIYLAVTSRTWPAWSTPDEDGHWQKIFQQHRATWKIFGNIPTCTLHIRSHPYHCTTPQMAIWGMVRLVRIEIWNPKNIEVPAVRRARGQIWNEKKKANISKSYLSQDVSSHWQNSPVTVSGVWQVHRPHSQEPRPEQTGALGGELGGLERKIQRDVNNRGGTCKLTLGSAGLCGCLNIHRSGRSSCISWIQWDPKLHIKAEGLASHC